MLNTLMPATEIDLAVSDAKELFNAHRPYETIDTLSGTKIVLNPHFTEEMVNSLSTSCTAALSDTEKVLLKQFIEWQSYLVDNNISAGSNDDMYVSTTDEKSALIEINNWLVDELAGTDHNVVCGGN